VHFSFEAQVMSVFSQAARAIFVIIGSSLNQPPEAFNQLLLPLISILVYNRDKTVRNLLVRLNNLAIAITALDLQKS
jgi:hypothetical protein